MLALTALPRTNNRISPPNRTFQISFAAELQQLLTLPGSAGVHYTLAPAAVLAGQSAGAWAGAGEARPLCVRPECYAWARFDSRYCSDRCGLQVIVGSLAFTRLASIFFPT